jgi:phage gpG-like protein
MARWGNCDYKQLQKLRDNLAKLQQVDMDKFCVDASKELAARLLALVIPRTPVGQYPKASGKKGGTLRRGWTGKKEQSSGEAYAASLPVQKTGSTYTIEVINPVGYASYVEFGHRTRGGKGWVNGQYFLTLSEQDLERIAPAVIEKKLEAMLREVFNV